MMQKILSTREKYDRNAGRYDLMEHFPETFLFRRLRKSLFLNVKGALILEIGVGTGKNIPHYPPDSRVIGVDFSEEMLKRAEAKARKLRPGVELMLMDVESLGFDAERFDAVVATFVFCSVPDPIKGLNEVRRVLKPNGRFYALEHVRPKGYFLGRLFDDFAPAVFARTGVHINRNTAENIRNAGFDIESEKKYMFDIVKMIVARPKFRLHDREVRA